MVGKQDQYSCMIHPPSTYAWHLPPPRPLDQVPICFESGISTSAFCASVHDVASGALLFSLSAVAFPATVLGSSPAHLPSRNGYACLTLEINPTCYSPGSIRQSKYISNLTASESKCEIQAIKKHCIRWGFKITNEIWQVRYITSLHSDTFEKYWKYWW